MTTEQWQEFDRLGEDITIEQPHANTPSGWWDWLRNRPRRRWRPTQAERDDVRSEIRHWLLKHGHEYGSKEAMRQALERRLYNVVGSRVGRYSLGWAWIVSLIVQVVIWWFSNREAANLADGTIASSQPVGAKP